MSNQQSFTFAIIGAGGRGTNFSNWLRGHPDAGKVVAVAEPNPERRKNVADTHNIPTELQFERWEELLAKPKLADVLINTTMDRLHVASAVKGLALGYHMILEKPMATSIEDCIAIDKARRVNKRIVCVCHSMRYSSVYTEVKKLIESGAIGDMVSFDQLEAVEHIHQSHSFVRGNWGNEARSTFMLLAKSCHDIDMFSWIVNKPCQRVSSFGQLSYFRKEYAPKGAPQYCTDGCPVEHSCPYSSLKVYAQENAHWVAHHAGLTQPTAAERLAKLKHTNFDKCVFQTDNDVVDHQVVAFEFEGGITGTFTMTAFTPFGGRFLRVHGTKGFIRAESDTNMIELHRHSDAKVDVIKIPHGQGSHGGADDLLMRNMMHALRTNDPSVITTGTDESLRSHAIAFAAEKARREKRVVELSEFNLTK
jgi:predicted dehydrogenase